MLLLYFAIYNIVGLLSATPDVPKGIDLSIWKLLQAIQREQKAGSALFAVTLLGFAVLTNFLRLRIEDLIQSLKDSVPASSVLSMDSASGALNELEHRIVHAKTRVFLTYFKAEPKTDRDTITYWETVTKSFARAHSKPLSIRRIASIDNVDKLRFLLHNNRLLFNEAKSKIGQIDYKLIVFPHANLKPLQMDIVDDAVILFSPYPEVTGSKPLLLTDWSIVNVYASHFQSMVKNLENKHTILNTSQKTASLYSDDEIRMVAHVMKFLLGLQEPDARVFDEMKPHCELTFDDFRKLYASLQG